MTTRIIDAALVNCPVGQEGTPQAANFASPGPTTDNSAKAATTSWVQSLLGLAGYSFTPGGAVSSSGGTQGHIKFPAFLGGFIIQWGNVAMPGSGSGNPFNPTSFNFDIAFPNACLACVPGTMSNNFADRITYVDAVTNSGGVMHNNGSLATAVYIAVGY